MRLNRGDQVQYATDRTEDLLKEMMPETYRSDGFAVQVAETKSS